MSHTRKTCFIHKKRTRKILFYFRVFFCHFISTFFFVPPLKELNPELDENLRSNIMEHCVFQFGLLSPEELLSVSAVPAYFSHVTPSHLCNFPQFSSCERWCRILEKSSFHCFPDLPTAVKRKKTLVKCSTNFIQNYQMKFETFLSH